jgi:1,4-dihydroxy-2-naphthoyl-CoA hydrolase
MSAPTLTPDQALGSMPFSGLMGVEFTAVAAPEVRATLAWSPERCTIGGLMHGGALMALADATGAVVAFLNLPEGATGTTTVSSATNFLRGVRDGHVEAISRPLHAGRGTIVVETDLIDANGKRVAKVTQTQAVLRPTEGGAVRPVGA